MFTGPSRSETSNRWSSGKSVGHDGDVAGALALLGRHRIVTVIGPGGVGKTRLARRVAYALWADYADGVVSVDLGAVLDLSDVPLALGTELRLSVPPASR